MRIRHRDIKPTNIGMLRDRISVHVFDLSQTYEDSSDSGSDGEVEEMTRRFAPPEVINWGYRSRLSDVFSMGAIFFEMLRSLRPKLPNPLHKKLQNFQYGQNSDLLQERLVELKVSLPSDLEPVWDLCRNMLSYEPRVLPTAQAILDALIESSRATGSMKTPGRSFVGKCMLSSLENEGNDSDTASVKTITLRWRKS
jgi:serine/threonine protein kinase